jgi:hypothetical protein
VLFTISNAVFAFANRKASGKFASMDQQHRDLILYKPECAIADDNGCTVDEVHAVLDRHPIEVDRDKYLKRALAMQLLQLDELEVAFRDKAIVDRDVAAGVLLVKVAERRATLLVFRLIHLHPTARLARVFFARWRLRMMDLAVAVHMKGFGCAFR